MNDTKQDYRRRLLLAGVASMATELVSGDAAGQQPPVTDSKAVRVVLENDNLRVLETISRPGKDMCGVGMHSHPPHLVIALSDAKVRVTLPDGKKIVVENKLGDVFWSEAETHITENIGGNSARAIVVYLKNPAVKKS